MKNFDTILRDVKRAVRARYERGFDLVTLSLANMLNRNLRKLIIKQGKNPDAPIPPSPPTRADLIKSIVSDDIQNRTARPFSFAGTPNSDWVVNKKNHPILKSRSKADLKRFASETAQLLAEAAGELDRAEPNYLKSEPLFDDEIPNEPPAMDVPDLSILLDDFKIPESPAKPPIKFSKKRYSLKDGKLITYRGNK